MTDLISISPIGKSSEHPLDGYSIERYPAGYCIKNPNGEYLWFGSDDGEEEHFFFTEGRRTRHDEYSQTKTCYSFTLAGAILDFKKWIKQELEDDESIPPVEVYKFK